MLARAELALAPFPERHQLLRIFGPPRRLFFPLGHTDMIAGWEAAVNPTLRPYSPATENGTIPPVRGRDYERGTGMDSRVADFIKELGIEETYRNGLRKVVDSVRNSPKFQEANPSNGTINKLIADATAAYVAEYGRVMGEKFESKYLDALLAYMKTPDGHNIVWSLYMTQVGVIERVPALSNEFVGKLFAKSKK
jgi:hypothetical protein